MHETYMVRKVWGGVGWGRGGGTRATISLSINQSIECPPCLLTLSLPPFALLCPFHPSRQNEDEEERQLLQQVMGRHWWQYRWTMMEDHIMVDAGQHPFPP